MKNSKKWWEKKWYWALSILLMSLVSFLIILLFFPEEPLTTILTYNVVPSLSFLLVYAIYRGLVRRFKWRVRRVNWILVGTVPGYFTWQFVFLPLADHFKIKHPMVFFSVFIFMAVGALIMDIIMKRRDYRPLIEGRGNI